MSTQEQQNKEPIAKDKESLAIKLDGLYALKIGMSTVFNEIGEAIPVTVLKYDPLIVSQVKTVSSDGYSAVQVVSHPRKAKNSSKADIGRFSKIGSECSFKLVKEIRIDKGSSVNESSLTNISVGANVLIESLSKGDIVQVTGCSKGKGFAGAMKRHGFSGGPASHGAGFHRRPGSVGNRTWPGRVMPGKRLPGQYGNKNVTVLGIEVVEVLPEESVLLVKGAVPGAKNGWLKLIKKMKK